MLLADSSASSIKSFLKQLAPVDQVGAEGRAAMLATRSIKTSSKKWAIDTAISMIDLTTLEGADTPGKVKALCIKAVHPDPTDSSVPHVGAVCVYNDMVQIAREQLDAAGGRVIPVAAVSTAFPSGRASLEVKERDTRDAILRGATEHRFRGRVEEHEAHGLDGRVRVRALVVTHRCDGDGSSVTGRPAEGAA